MIEIPPVRPGVTTTEAGAASTPGAVEAPVLLIQLQDDLARSRRREAFWISIIVHLVLVIAIVAAPKYLPVHRLIAVRSAEDLLRQRDLTFLELPPDQQKVKVRPNTDKLSDKDRIAMSKAPVIDRKALEDIRDARRPGAPGVSAPPAPKPGPQEMAQASPPAQQGPQSQSMRPNPQSDSNLTARLEAPPRAPITRPFSGTMSPGSAIEQAARAAAMARGGGFSGAGGDYGLGQGSPHGAVGGMDVLSDTMGVDFGPYLQRVLHDVRENWYQLIPEVARAPLMKRGRVSIEFAILKNGQVAGLRIVGPSGDISLDRAAYGGITASIPFSPLPAEFKGQYLALRFHFFYNPDKHDLE